MLNQDRIVKSMFNKLIASVSDTEAKSRIIEKFPEYDGELDFVLSNENTIKDYTKKVSKKDIKKMSFVEDSIESLEDDETELYLSDDEKDPEEVKPVVKETKKPRKVKKVTIPSKVTSVSTKSIKEQVKDIYNKYNKCGTNLVIKYIMDELKLDKTQATIYFLVVSE